LEKNFETFATQRWEDLVRHGLKALRASAQETDLTVKNVSVGVVGKDMAFRVLSEEELRSFIDENQMDTS